ncbi:MAG: DUF481 domain-containing protein [Opitutales bacterium]
MESNLQAAELQLTNGDRITGEVVQRQDGMIYFRSPILGEITVAETDAIVIDTPETPVESLTGLPPSPAAAGSTQANPTVASPGKTAGTKKMVPELAVVSKWRGKLEFGFTDQTALTSVTNLSFRVEADRKNGPNNYTVTSRYLYGKTNQIVSADRQDASFRWRRDISSTLFVQSQTSYTRDLMSQINIDLEQNESIGYQILKSPAQKVSVGTGLTAQYRDAAGVVPGLNYLGEVFQDYTYKINGRLTFIEGLNALYSPASRFRMVTTGVNPTNIDSSAQNYKFQFNSTLQGKMSERISMNLRYEYEYDNAILQTLGRTNQRITSSVGYSF